MINILDAGSPIEAVDDGNNRNIFSQCGFPDISKVKGWISFASEDRISFYVNGNSYGLEASCPRNYFGEYFKTDRSRNYSNAYIKKEHYAKTFPQSCFINPNK